MNNFTADFGNTPIDCNEMQGLIPTHIITQAELNECEQANIIQAQLWLNSKSYQPKEILNQAFIKTLHHKMFNETWQWAGKLRRTDKNIGIDWVNIPVYLQQLLDDINFYLLNKTYNIDEIATRFHHRLVLIHPFVNGNGRFARIVTDIFLAANNAKIFSWGRINYHDKDALRRAYILALRTADKHDYSLLLNFVRS